MRSSARTRSITAGVALAIAALTPAAATAAEDRTVDQSLLQPPLLERFAPWDCTWRHSGIVCVGEFHEVGDWAPTDLPCAEPVYAARTEHRYQRLFFDEQYRNYDRQNRTRDTELFSTSPDGSAAGTLYTNVRYSYDYGVPGDLSTVTLTTTGVIWDLAPAQGPAIFRAVGTLVEPSDAPPTFTGHVTIDGVTTVYEDAPLDTFLTDERFVSWLCEAATGEPAVFE